MFHNIQIVILLDGSVSDRLSMLEMATGPLIYTARAFFKNHLTSWNIYAGRNSAKLQDISCISASTIDKGLQSATYFHDLMNISHWQIYSLLLFFYSSIQILIVDLNTFFPFRDHMSSQDVVDFVHEKLNSVSPHFLYML